MTKPQLMLFGGWGHSASTPFYYTLALDNNYCHAGHKKEIGYLTELENYEFFGKNMWIGCHTDPYERLLGHGKHCWDVPEILDRHSPYNKHSEEFIRDWISEPPSIEKYIDYMLLHYENIKHDYQAVADFANSNGWLRKPFLDKYAPILNSVFDVKCIFMCRDPVHRSYSDFSAKFTGNDPSGKLLKEGQLYPDIPLEKQYDQIDEMFIGELDKSCTRFYVDFYTKFKKYFNTMQLVMEEFWEPDLRDSQLQRLSNFLGYPITKIHDNVFWPASTKKYEHLKDQWGAVDKPISKDLHQYGKNILFPVYKQWKDKFGVLPNTWGEYI